MTERENLINAAINIMSVLTPEERSQVLNNFTTNASIPVRPTSESYPYTFSRIMSIANVAAKNYPNYYYMFSAIKKTNHAYSFKNENYGSPQWRYDEFAKDEIVKQIREKEIQDISNKLQENSYSEISTSII